MWFSVTLKAKAVSNTTLKWYILQHKHVCIVIVFLNVICKLEHHFLENSADVTWHALNLTYLGCKLSATTAPRKHLCFQLVWMHNNGYAQTSKIHSHAITLQTLDMKANVDKKGSTRHITVEEPVQHVKTNRLSARQLLCMQWQGGRLGALGRKAKCHPPIGMEHNLATHCVTVVFVLHHLLF
jgi:hypothetical protein